MRETNLAARSAGRARFRAPRALPTALFSAVVAVVTLAGCNRGGAPAAHFQMTAAPNGNSFGRKVFCADESGVIRSSADGNPATCLASGAPSSCESA